MQNNYTTFLAGSSNIPSAIGQRLWAALFGEERPRDMFILLLLLVLFLHVWLLIELIRPKQKISEAKPLVMEVSMIAIPAPKSAAAPSPPAVAPVKPVPPKPPVAEKKPQPKKKPVAKPVVKTPSPEVQKAPDFAPFVPLPLESSKQTSASSSNTATTTPNSTATGSTNSSEITEANFRANYAHNPKPEYPTIAKSRGWQGKVMLRVKVSAQGLSDAVTVEKSSGHEMLDESAIEAVKQWRFIPAKRGDTPISSSVIVPIVFTLRN